MSLLSVHLSFALLTYHELVRWGGVWGRYWTVYSCRMNWASSLSVFLNCLLHDRWSTAVTRQGHAPLCIRKGTAQGRRSLVLDYEVKWPRATHRFQKVDPRRGIPGLLFHLQIKYGLTVEYETREVTKPWSFCPVFPLSERTLTCLDVPRPCRQWRWTWSIRGMIVTGDVRPSNI